MEIDLSGVRTKTVLITGATSGIGAAASLELARAGAKVILVGRSLRKCQNTAHAIRRSTENPGVEFLLADLSSLKEIRALAEEFRRRCGSLDVLVNNAGALFNRREVSIDGLEMTFAVNHMAYFLLTVLLLDLLKRSSEGRIVVVSSHAHEGVRIDFNDLQSERRYDRLEAYGRSKLANLLFTFELAKRLQGTGVTANAMTPGSVATRLGANNGWLKAKVRNAVYLAQGSMSTPAVGARTILYLAASPEVRGVNGCYFRDGKEVSSSSASKDETAALRLWKISEQLAGMAGG